MSTWSFVLSHGGDITALVDVQSIVRTRRLFTELVPNTNRLDFRAKFDASVFASLMANDIVEIAVSKDGAAYFTGVLSPNYKTTIRDGQRYMALIAEDYTQARLGQTVAAPFACAGFAVCTPASPSTSLVHAIATQAGVTLASSLPTISSVVPYVVALPDDKTTWGTLLAGILFEYGYVYQFDPDGKLSIPNAVNTSTITTTATLTTAAGSANIRGELEIEKSPERYDDIRIKYDLVELKTGIVLFQDTTGGTDAQACTIPLAAVGDSGGKDYYPLTSKIGEVFSAWKNPDGYDIWVATSAALDATMDSGIVADRSLSNYYRKCSFSYKNTTAGIKNITKLRITGNAYVVVSRNTARSSIVSAKKLYEYESKYIFNDSDAAILANALAQYYLYSDIKYVARSKDVLDIGEYVLISDAIYSGLSTKCRVVGIVDQENAYGVIKYELEGVADFNAITIDTEGEGVPNTVVPPGSVPAPDNNVTNVVFDEAQNSDGTVRVTATWDYVQGTNTADAAFIYWNWAISSAPAAFDYSLDTAAAKAMTGDGTYSWSEDFPGRTGGTGGAPYRYQFGVVAARGALLHTNGAVTPTGWDDKMLVPIISDMTIRSSDGQGVNRRAIQLANSSLDWLDTPDTSPASPELLVARIGRLGVGGAVLLDGEFEAPLTTIWTSALLVNAAISSDVTYLQQIDGTLRMAYIRTSDHYLVERISSDFITYSAESVICNAISSSPQYIQLDDGAIKIYYRKYSGGYIVERVLSSGVWGVETQILSGITSSIRVVSDATNNIIRLSYLHADSTLYEITWDGSAWSSESVINNSACSDHAYIYSNGYIYIAYRRSSDTYLVERKYTAPSWGNESIINSAGSYNAAYIQPLSGDRRIAYRRASDGYAVERAHSGESWGGETIINASISTYLTYAQLSSGDLCLAYIDNASGYIYQRTLQRYARVGAGIVESGSNANGSYVKYGDGTMQCYGTMTGTTVPINPRTQTLPASFINTAYSVALTIIEMGAVRVVADLKAKSTGSFTSDVIYTDSGTAAGEAVSWQAIGRWKA